MSMLGSLAAASAFAAFGTANAADTFPTIERAAKGDITAWGGARRLQGDQTELVRQSLSPKDSALGRIPGDSGRAPSGAGEVWLDGKRGIDYPEEWCIFVVVKGCLCHKIGLTYIHIGRERG